jgi:hypothetical protein
MAAWLCEAVAGPPDLRPSGGSIVEPVFELLHEGHTRGASPGVRPRSPTRVVPR